MELPQKTRVIQSFLQDSEKWEHFKMRDDDIVVATSYKCGTTWMQNIILQLLYQGREIPETATDMCPWLDLRQPPIEVLNELLEATTERRQIKTHLRLDALKFNSKAKYVYLARDGRDTYISFCNHYKNQKDVLYQMMNESPGRVGPPCPHWDEVGYTDATWFDDWISKGWTFVDGLKDESDGYPYWSLFDNIMSWWKYRHLDNILFIHFNDLLHDLEGNMRKVAAYLDIPIQEGEAFQTAVRRCTFEDMKKNATKTGIVPNREVFKGGAETFINKGTNGRWKGVLSEEQLKKYDEVVKNKMTLEAAAWMEHGAVAGDPKKM